VRSDAFDCAEVAIEVVDAWQRRGVGEALMQALRQRALRAGIRRFTATVLSGNKGAFALVRRLDPRPVVTVRGSVVEVSGCWRRDA
jgi:L-amino acid N-acyltransferase YncA